VVEVQRSWYSGSYPVTTSRRVESESPEEAGDPVGRPAVSASECGEVAVPAALEQKQVPPVRHQAIVRAQQTVGQIGSPRSYQAAAFALLSGADLETEPYTVERQAHR
jgi:hypothetical protein